MVNSKSTGQKGKKVFNTLYMNLYFIKEKIYLFLKNVGHGASMYGPLHGPAQLQDKMTKFGELSHNVNCF